LQTEFPASGEEMQQGCLA